MNVYEYLAWTTARKDSKLAPHAQEIRVLLEHRRSYPAITRYLFEEHAVRVTRQSVREFCRLHFPELTHPSGRVDLSDASVPQQPSEQATERARRSTEGLRTIQRQLTADNANVSTAQRQAASAATRSAEQHQGLSLPPVAQTAPTLVSTASPSTVDHSHTPGEPSQPSDSNTPPETPAFEPPPVVPTTTIEQPGNHVDSAKRALAFLSRPKRRGESVRDDDLDALSDAIQAAAREKRNQTR